MTGAFFHRLEQGVIEGQAVENVGLQSGQPCAQILQGKKFALDLGFAFFFDEIVFKMFGHGASCD
jgi:hypothetical protein